MLALKLIMIFMMDYLKKKNNKLTNYKYFKELLIVILLSAVVVSGCKKSENLGLDVVADPDAALNVGFDDSYRLITYSTLIDTIPTKNVGMVMLGSEVDPVFGTTTDGFYSQLRLSNNNLDFGSNPICDSIVFSMDYAGFYGDSTGVQHIKVFELDEGFVTDTPYYSNSVLALKSPAIFDEDVTFNLKDSITLFGKKTKPHLRLTLDNAFGTKILDKSGSAELVDNEAFLKFIKGLRVIADEAVMGGGIASLNLLSSLSSVTLYYHNDDDTTYEVFLINENCDRFTTFNHHDFYNANMEFTNQVVNGDTSLGQQEFYLQGMASTRGYISIRDIDSLANEDPIAVQLAELVFNVSSTSTKHEIPKSVSLIGINDDGKNVFLQESDGGRSNFGGHYDDVNKQYVFNITRTVQAMFLGKSEIKAFRLVISGEVVTPNRVILKGADASQGTRLRIYYTKAL